MGKVYNREQKITKEGEEKINASREKYNKISDAETKALEGDLQYFIDLKQNLGEEGFRCFISQADYKSREYVLSRNPVPDNSIFKKAIDAKKLNVCRFLLENGLSPHQSCVYHAIRRSYFYKESEAAEIFKLVIDAGVDLLKPPFADIKKIYSPQVFENELFKTYNLVISANDTVSLDLLYHYYKNYDWNKYVCGCIQQGTVVDPPKKTNPISDFKESFDERETAQKYLTSIDWLLYTAIKLRSVDCALWALNNGADINSKAYRYTEKKSKMKTSEYLLYLAAREIEDIVYRSQSYTVRHQDEGPLELDTVDPSLWGDTRNVLLAIVQKTGLEEPNKGSVFIKFLQKQFNLDPNKPIEWDPNAFFNVMKGLSLCWAVMDTYPVEYALAVKDSKGHDIRWYIENMPKMVALSNRHSNSKDGLIEEDEVTLFKVMLKFADLCQRKYEILANLDSKHMEANEFLLDYEI